MFIEYSELYTYSKFGALYSTTSTNYNTWVLLPLQSSLGVVKGTSSFS